jgi:hypothetical protein
MPELRHTTCPLCPNPRYFNEDNEEFEQGSSRLRMAQLLNAADTPYKELVAG